MSLTPSSSYVANERIKTQIKLDNIFLRKLQVYLKSWFFIAV